MAALRLSPTGEKELHESCAGLVSLLPDPEAWLMVGQPFRGLVVGAVQSGKTGSMIGLTAMALDQGYRIVVVLSGNKDDLRRQTARRFNVQLLRKSELIPESGGARTLAEHEAIGARPSFSLPYDRDAHQYAAFHSGFQAALERDQPAILVIKKHISSLSDVRRKLQIAYERFGVAALPTLVLDDECDDASVDREAMPIPAAIAGLWRWGGEHPRVAYVGYTATSAANLLQHRDNDLFPQNFVSLLRYPDREDTALSYAEPSPDLWYTGGHTYYEEVEAAPDSGDALLVIPTLDQQKLQGPVASNEDVLSAARAYIVGGAYRLALRPGWSFEDPARVPPPHSMLVQTSAAQSDHKVWLEGLAALFDGSRKGTSVEYQWSPESVMRAVGAREEPWRHWYDTFAKSRARVLEDRPRVGGGGVATWDHVKACITPFIKEMKIKVVNSEEGVGSDLDFQARIGRDGSPVRPRDIFVIVIGGAKLSRGLTIEGLVVTFFTRWNPTPTEDTVVQLSRWYGYRGPFLEFCRLFTTETIYGQLTDMESNDRELRGELAALMAAHKSPADAALVIAANPKALPTGKIGEGRVHDLAFSPFATVFRHVELRSDDLQAHNEEVALRLTAAIRERSPQRVVAASGALRGFVSRSWSSTEVAAVLDSLAFSDHNPSEKANPARGHFRRPDASRPIVTGRNLAEDPYQVAAYLRQWDAGDQAPCFNVGVAYGEMIDDTAPFTFPLVNREITEHLEVVGGWTGRRAGWRGDQLFDDPDPSQIVAGTTERCQGACGLLLMYVIHKDAIGRHGRGRQRPFHTPTFGIVVPQGGQVWRRVTVDRRRLVVE